MHQLTEHDIHRHLRNFGRELAIAEAVINRATRELAKAYVSTNKHVRHALTTTGPTKEQELRFLQAEFLRRVDGLLDAYETQLEQRTRAALSRAQQQPKKGFLDRLDEAVLGPPGSPLYKFGAFLIGKKGDD